MKAFKKTFILAGYLAIGVLLSCEIEDEYFYPDRSEQLGTKVFQGTYAPVALLWAETTNEVIVVNIDGITAIEADSKKVRKLPFDPSYFTTQSAWIVGNAMYLLNTNGGISKVDLARLSYTGTLVDSAFLHVFSSPFAATHFAYTKFNDMSEPLIFLYDLISHEETFIGIGLPYVFSPDGQQLVISYYGDFFVYNLATKATTTLNFSEGNETMLTWTTDGIISFQYQNESIIVSNESTNTRIGQWKSVYGLYGRVVSPSGKHIITSEFVCTYTDPTISNCANGGKTKHAIVEIDTDTEVPKAYTVTKYIFLTAFSPDEKTFAFSTHDYGVYIIEPQN